MARLRLVILAGTMMLTVGSSQPWARTQFDSTTPSTAPINIAESKPAVVIHAFDEGLAGVRAANPAVHVSVDRDAAIPDERVLVVDYPVPTGEPAARDVQCAAEHQDWTSGRAIAFQIKPAHSLRLSVSFLDRNHVAYTAYADLKGGEWQQVRIPFDEIRPNQFFQPPDARTGAPLDVSDVKNIAFAPHDQTSGRLTIGRFVVSQ